jgi:hypothetical protein
MALDGLLGIVGAGRPVSTARGQEWRNPAPVRREDPHGGLARPGLHGPTCAATPSSAAATPARNTENPCVRHPRRATKQSRSPSPGRRACSRRNASRRRRRPRFLTTLPPSRRPAMNPVARRPDLRTHSKMKPSRSMRWPSRNSSRTSGSPRNRSRRGSLAVWVFSGRHTVSRLRPLARRRFSTFRPPFVDIRSRNPCVFARRRRFG